MLAFELWTCLTFGLHPQHVGNIIGTLFRIESGSNAITTAIAFGRGARAHLLICSAGCNMRPTRQYMCSVGGVVSGKAPPYAADIFLEEIADHIAFWKGLNVGTSHPQVRRTSESLPCWDICLPKSKNKSDSLPWGIQF